jgi:DNA repair protein RadC
MAKGGGLREWARADRPREKLLDQGAAALSAVELLAVLLRTGTEGGTVLDQARAVLERCGHRLRGLGGLGLRELCSVKGVGPAKAAQLLALVELAKRFGEEEFAPGMAFKGSHDVYAHFRERLAHERQEQFYAVLLDNKNRKLKDIRISQGSLTASIVHPRDVYLPVIRESAAAVIFVRNRGNVRRRARRISRSRAACARSVSWSACACSIIWSSAAAAMELRRRRLLVSAARSDGPNANGTLRCNGEQAMDVAGKAAITGAGPGNRTGARRFAAEGAAVVVAERDQALGAAVADELTRGCGARAVFVPTDVATRRRSRRWSPRPWRRSTHHVLVSNAWAAEASVGWSTRPMPICSPVCRWRCSAPSGRCGRSFRTMRRQGGGRIIALCSLNGVNAHMHGRVQQRQGALRALTRTAAREWARHSILANVICPAATPAYEAFFIRPRQCGRCCAEPEGAWAIPNATSAASRCSSLRMRPTSPATIYTDGGSPSTGGVGAGAARLSRRAVP